jgi:hypothetical protein
MGNELALARRMRRLGNSSALVDSWLGALSLKPDRGRHEALIFKVACPRHEGQICHSGELKAGIFIPFLYGSECTSRGSEDFVQLRESGTVLFKFPGRLPRIQVNTEQKVAQPAWWTTLPTCRNA